MQIVFNGESQEVAKGVTVAALLRQMHLAARQVAVEVNLDVVPRENHESHALQDGDRVEVVTLVGGG